MVFFQLSYTGRALNRAHTASVFGGGMRFTKCLKIVAYLFIFAHNYIIVLKKKNPVNKYRRENT